MEYLSLSDLCKQDCHLWMSMLLFTWIGWPIPLSGVSILRSGVSPNHDQPFHLTAQQTYGLCYYTGIVLPFFTFHHESISSTEWYHSEIRPDIEHSSKLTRKCNYEKQCSRRMCTFSISWSNWTFWIILKLPESLSKGSSVHKVTIGGTTHCGLLCPYGPAQVGMQLIVVQD